MTPSNPLPPTTKEEREELRCNDCPAPYGKDGWCDVIVPDEIWNTIAPKGGVLCFRCMTKRIDAHGLSDVPVIVASGPYKDANEEWRLIGWEHGHRVGASDVERLEGQLAVAKSGLNRIANDSIGNGQWSRSGLIEIAERALASMSSPAPREPIIPHSR